MTGDDDLTARLRATNPLPSGIAHTDATRARMDEIRLWARSGLREPSPSRRGLRLLIARRGVVVGSAIGVLAVGGAAAATTILSTSTVGAPGFCQTAINATASIPFPAGDQAARNWALLDVVGPKAGTTLHELCDTPAGAHVADGGYPGTSQVSTESERAETAMVAFCAWTGEWLGAEQNGDTATESSAANEIAGALQWPASQAVDPHPVAGASAGTRLGWFISVQQAVQADDVATVSALFNPQDLSGPNAIYPNGFCYLNEPPADSDDGTVVPGGQG